MMVVAEVVGAVKGDISVAGFWVGLGLCVIGWGLHYFGKGR